MDGVSGGAGRRTKIVSKLAPTWHWLGYEELMRFGTSRHAVIAESRCEPGHI
jgi:hypothetical protein